MRLPLMLLKPISAGAAALLVAATMLAGAAAAEPKVVASIKPIHSLAAGVMAGVAEPALLVRGAASPHTYSLRPSDARALSEADLVFWIGESFEMFLVKPLETLAGKARIVALADTEGLILLPTRTGGLWEAHDHAHGEEEAAGHGDHHHHADEHAHAEDSAHAAEAEHGHAHEAIDGHLWLDPRNAKRLVARMAEALSAADPANAATYRANAAGLSERLEALDAELEAALAPVRGTPFIVFHDAYQYFEARYGLNGIGSITLNPEQPPGARRMEEIRARIAAADVHCVFREPQFEPALVEAAVEGTRAQIGELDPEGARIADGPELYFELMRSIAGALKACLAETG